MSLLPRCASGAAAGRRRVGEPQQLAAAQSASRVGRTPDQIAALRRQRPHWTRDRAGPRALRRGPCRGFCGGQGRAAGASWDLDIKKLGRIERRGVGCEFAHVVIDGGVDAKGILLFGAYWIHDRANHPDGIYRKASTLRVFANVFFIGRDVDAEDLVISEIAVQPLHARAHFLEHTARGFGNLATLPWRE